MHRKCIICYHEFPEALFSEEHVFPESIGGRLVIRNVCRECNSDLGSIVDAPLVNHYYISLVRTALDIKGKSGKIPNPFGTGTLTSDPAQKIRVSLDANEESLGLYIVPNPSFTTLENGSQQVQLVVDKKDSENIGTIIRKVAERKGLPCPSIEDIEKNMSEERELYPQIKLNFTLDILHYKRSILKIAYELAHYWLGDDYFNDPIGRMIRDCMLDQNITTEFHEEYPIRGLIRPVGEQPLFPFWESEPNSNIGILTKQDNNIACYVNVLGVFNGMIIVSEDASKYPTLEGEFIIMHPTSGEYRESSFMDEILRITALADGI